MTGSYINAPPKGPKERLSQYAQEGNSPYNKESRATHPEANKWINNHFTCNRFKLYNDKVIFERKLRLTLKWLFFRERKRAERHLGNKRNYNALGVKWLARILWIVITRFNSFNGTSE